MPTTIRLDEVKYVGIRFGFCSACGKPTKRQRSWTRYVNAAHRHKDGTVKTANDHRQELLALARAWQPNHDHENCPPIRAERVARRLARK